MVSVIEFSISAALFLALLVVLIIYTSIYISHHYKQITLEKMRAEARDFSENFLLSKNSEVSFLSTFYKRKILVKEINNESFDGYVSIKIVFDENCEKKAFNNSIRVFDENFYDVNFSLQNVSYCDSFFVKSANLIFYVSLKPLQERFYYITYSPDTFIKSKENYFSLTPTNILKITIFPEEKSESISVSKILEVRKNLTIEKLRELTGVYNVYVEIQPSK